MTRTAVLTLGAATAVLAASACGGEDRLSREEFEEQGNAICARYDREIEAITSPTSLEEIPAYIDKTLPLVEREIDELKELRPPEEDEEAFDAMVAEAEKTLAAGREIREAAERGDEAGVEDALDDGNTAGNRADEHARELGLTACVEENS